MTLRFLHATCRRVLKNRKKCLCSKVHGLSSTNGWYIYSPSQQGGYCKHCVLFPPKVSRITPGVLVALPMQKCNKATGRQWVLSFTRPRSVSQRCCDAYSLAFCEVPMEERTAHPHTP